jgi:large subunit ribosomal protein L23
MPKQLTAHGIITRPLITEKAQRATTQNKYVFEVDKRANKMQIREAVELAFNVRVTAVHTVSMRGKVKRYGIRRTRMPDWKKAVVTLAAGDKIELFEGV